MASPDVYGDRRDDGSEASATAAVCSFFVVVAQRTKPAFFYKSGKYVRACWVPFWDSAQQAPKFDMSGPHIFTRIIVFLGHSGLLQSSNWSFPRPVGFCWSQIFPGVSQCPQPRERGVATLMMPNSRQTESKSKSKGHSIVGSTAAWTVRMTMPLYTLGIDTPWH